jgi:hypothetical protein
MAPAGRAIPTPFRRARDIESHGRVPVALRTGSRGIALSSCDLDAMQEGAMPHRLTRHNRPVSDHLHPLVYAVVAGTALWFVLPAWIFFGGAEYMVLLLAVVSGFFLMAAAIPFVLWRVWLKHHAARENRMSFRDWASGEFETQPGRRKALDAAIEIILPLAAAAAGMTAMGLTFHFTAVGSQI